MRSILVPVSLLLALSGCAEPEERPLLQRYDDVLISPQLMRTGLDAQDVMLGVIGSRVSVAFADHGRYEAEELPRWDGAVRLVRWPSAELVPGVWRQGFEEGRHTFRFEPEAPSYEEGWYAVQIDFAAIGETRGPARRTELPVIDGWTTNAFRIGTQPLIKFDGTLSASELNESRAVIFQSTERIPMSEVRRFEEFLEVRVNNTPHRCSSDSIFGPSPMFEVSNPFETARAHCDPVPEGALIEIGIRDGFFDVPVMDYRGHSPPTWSFRAGEVPDNVGPVDEVFVGEDGR